MSLSSSTGSVPFGPSFIVSVISAAYGLILFVNCVICFNLFDGGFPAVETILLLLLGGWAGTALADSDGAAIKGFAALSIALVSCFFLFLLQSPLLFWLVFGALFLLVVNQLPNSFNLSLSSIAQSLFLLFIIGTSLLVLAKVFAPRLAQEILHDVAQLPLIDIRLGMTIAFAVIAIIAGTTRTIQTFSYGFVEFVAAPASIMPSDDRFSNAIRAFFVDLRWFVLSSFRWLWWTVIMSFLRNVVIFFVNVGKASFKFSVDALASSLIWRAVSRVLLTSGLIAIASVVARNAVPHVRKVVTAPHAIFDPDTSTLLSSGYLIAVYFTSIFIVAAIVAIWHPHYPNANERRLPVYSIHRPLVVPLHLARRNK